MQTDLARLCRAVALAMLVGQPWTSPATAQEPRPPLLNRANEALPAWLRVRAEFRERMEGFDGAGFAEESGDLYWLSRLRLNATVKPTPWAGLVLQAQDARVTGKEVGPTGAPFRATLDLRVAAADLGREQSPVALRLGRQELAFGEQRLLGHVSWLNAARSFDGARLTIRGGAFQADLFGASVVRILDGEIDRSGNGNRLLGVYAAAPRLIPGSAVEPFVLWRRDTGRPTETGGTGNLEQTTVGVRLAGRLPANLDYGIEVALQDGSLGSDDIRAWAGHWQLRYSPPVPGALRLTTEYNYASGDQDPADGVRGTFDQLYPTPHDKYGLADQVGWKNVHHLRGGVELRPWQDLPLRADYHTWWLAEVTDALYTAGGAPLARVASGAPDARVGQELDVQASYPLTSQLQLAAGLAQLFPGQFLKDATPGASYRHGYLMVTYVFLAEQ